MTYLDVDKYKQKLIAKKGCNSAFLDCLPDYIETAQDLMDEYLGKNFGVNKYVEKRTTNHIGTIVLWNSPVITVEKIAVIDSLLYSGDTITKYQFLDPIVCWDGLLTIDTGNCDCDRAQYEITYTAGLDPLPKSFSLVQKAIVNQLMLSDGDIGILMESPREVEEAQNPSIGGTFKQRFRRSTVAGTTKLDQLMKSLGKYKVKVKLG